MPRLRPASLPSFLSVAALAASAMLVASSAGAAPPSGKPLANDVLDLPGQIVVDFKDDTSDEDIARIGTDLGITFHANSILGVDDKIELATVSPSAEASLLARLAKD